MAATFLLAIESANLLLLTNQDMLVRLTDTGLLTHLYLPYPTWNSDWT